MKTLFLHLNYKIRTAITVHAETNITVDKIQQVVYAVVTKLCKLREGKDT